MHVFNETQCFKSIGPLIDPLMAFQCVTDKEKHNEFI